MSKTMFSEESKSSGSPARFYPYAAALKDYGLYQDFTEAVAKNDLPRAALVCGRAKSLCINEMRRKHRCSLPAASRSRRVRRLDKLTQEIGREITARSLHR